MFIFFHRHVFNGYDGSSSNKNDYIIPCRLLTRIDTIHTCGYMGGTGTGFISLSSASKQPLK